MSGDDPLARLPHLTAFVAALRDSGAHPFGRDLAEELMALTGQGLPAAPAADAIGGFEISITPGDVGTMVIVVGKPGSGRPTTGGPKPRPPAPRPGPRALTATDEACPTCGRPI
jgi:hypothetical protein